MVFPFLCDQAVVTASYPISYLDRRLEHVTLQDSNFELYINKEYSIDVADLRTPAVIYETLSIIALFRRLQILLELFTTSQLRNYGSRSSEL
jgi:hypothetical protein